MKTKTLRNIVYSTFLVGYISTASSLNKDAEIPSIPQSYIHMPSNHNNSNNSLDKKVYHYYFSYPKTEIIVSAMVFLSALAISTPEIIKQLRE